MSNISNYKPLKEPPTFVDIDPINLFYEYGSIRYKVTVEQYDLLSLDQIKAKEGIIWMLLATRSNLDYHHWVPADTLIWGIPRTYTAGNKQVKWTCTEKWAQKDCIFEYFYSPDIKFKV